MLAPAARPDVARKAAVVVLAATVLLGAFVRFEETSGTGIIPAEDPFTHMTLVRGHVGDGQLDPMHEGGTLYPPGLHGTLAAIWVFTGMNLETLFLHGPALFGAIGVLGIALLLWRNAGPAAAVVGALAYALAPEVIFRTTMMSPTALDMALLPFLLLALIECARGALAWLVAIVPLIVFFSFAHPWVLAIVAPAALAYTLARIILIKGLRPAAAIGMGANLLVMGIALTATVNACYSMCGLGFQDIAVEGDSGATGLDAMGNLGAALSVLVGVALIAWAWRTRGVVSPEQPRRWPIRVTMAAVAAIAALAVIVPAQANGMPEHVELPRMFGWPILALAAAGLLAASLRPHPASLMGASLVAVTLPFVVHNPFDSPFWPHRTAAYLGIGLVVLAGTGATAIVHVLRLAGQRIPMVRDAGHQARSVRNGLAVPFAITLLLAGSVWAATPLTYETGWYRLYPECEYDQLKQMGQDADEDTLIITGDWRPKLVISAFAPPESEVWFDRGFFTDQQRRDDTVHGLGLDGRHVIVVVDRHMRLEHPDTDTSFLHSQPWRQVDAPCSGMGIAGARMQIYTNQEALP